MTRRSDRAVLKCAFGRGGYKLSLLLFVNIFGPAAYKIFHGSVTEDRFVSFCAERLVDIIGEWPAANSIVIIDNVSFHHNEAVHNIIEEAGAIIVYLPAYTPWMNLAEYFFHGIKEEERRKQVYGEAEGLLSLIESVEAMRGRRWINIIRKVTGNC